MSEEIVNFTALSRDIQTAADINTMVALGAFPKEIVVYGTVYYQDGQRKYLLSCDSGKIISFLNEPDHRVWFPVAMERYMERLLIPEGAEDRVRKEVKLHMAQQLQQKYPEELFRVLAALQKKPGNAAMDGAMKGYRIQMEREFDIDRLKAFRELCVKAYLRKNLSEEVFRQLTEWGKERILRLESRIPPVKGKEKLFYGLASFQNGKLEKSYINANLKCLYEEQERLEKQGKEVTAWHQRKFYIEGQGSLEAYRKEMMTMLECAYDERYLELDEMLKRCPMVISLEEAESLRKMAANYGAAAENLAERYLKQWGSIPKGKQEDKANE